MITIKLYGGLGNQMFQYATGKALALRLKTNLYLDIGWFKEIKGNDDVTQRVYELGDLGIVPKRINFIEKLGSRLRPSILFKEQSLDYQHEFEKLSGNIMLDGYWQSYKYFDDYRDEIIKDFKFPQSMSTKNKRLMEDINSTESVSIHVRRGDYATKRGKSFHGQVPTSYYEKALSQLKEKENVTGFELFIFSDEIEWCKKTLKFGTPAKFIDSNSSSAGVEDMRLMAACKHNIIANSSFSWWAAWLNQYPKKIVFAPEKWFKKTNENLDDRLPPGWIRL